MFWPVKRSDQGLSKGLHGGQSLGDGKKSMPMVSTYGQWARLQCPDTIEDMPAAPLIDLLLDSAELLKAWTLTQDM